MASLSSAPALSTDLLAIVVAVVAFVVSGLFLLVLVPERALTREAAPARTGIADEKLRRRARAGSEGARPAAVVATAPPSAGQPATGAGGQSREPGRWPVTSPSSATGSAISLPVDSIVAVHANAHYTYVFDGTAKYFCPLAIGDVKSRLDPARFARVHRSHIINVEHVLRFRRAGDNGLIELRGATPIPSP